MADNIRRGIILMNLGSPASTEVRDVKRYLDEFLMDERVIDSPFLLRAFLVKAIIVPFRAPQSAEAYKKIWTEEGSPLIVLTKQLQQALQDQVAEPVVMAMRYGTPSIRQAYEELLRRCPDIEEVILLPLYPQYAMSSYETAVEDALKQHRKGGYSFSIKTIKPYYNEPRYLEALSESIAPYLQQDYDQIVFSYHGIPERHIRKGDVTGRHCLKTADCCQVASEAHKYCYRHQCFATTSLIAGRLGIPKEKFSQSFQSRLGRAEWLKPYTAVRLAELPGEGVKKLLVVCPAFISDCLETLEEMGQEGRHIFMEAGGESFTLIPCLNVHPAWLRTIDSWMEQIRSGDHSMIIDY